MNSLFLLAHEGHDHSEPAAVVLPEWQLSLLVIASFVLLCAVIKALRLRTHTQTALLMLTLLLTGLLLYRWTPLVSGAALVAGFALAFFTAFGQLSKRT